MAPALAHGLILGPYDILVRHGLSARPGIRVHDGQTADLITEMIPWTSVAWTQVHHGHLPLWNPYNALGMPLAFNWQSGVFSLPSLLGYIAPLHLAYTVQILATLVIAGTGVYVFGRVLHLSVLGCTMAGIVFVLSGQFFGWTGWPVASVMSWAGWLFAAGVLVVRGRRRGLAIPFLALALAFAIYAGQPDALVLLGIGFVVFVGVVLVVRAPGLGGAGPIARPVLDLALGLGAGGALGAPLALPGVQAMLGGIRTSRSGSQALSLHSLESIFFQGFDGLPISGSHFFGQLYGNINYLQSALYVGVIALVLAAVAVARRVREPEVLAMTAVLIVMTVLVFEPVAASILDHLPYGVLWNRGAIVFCFSIAVLAGVGADVIVKSIRERSVQRWAGGGFAVCALILILLWLFGRGDLPSAEATIRAHSFVWPAAQALLGLVLVSWVWLGTSRHEDGHTSARFARVARVAGVRSIDAGTALAAVLLVCEAAFLVTAGAPLWSSTATSPSPTRAEATLERAVGTAVVAFGAHACTIPGHIGIAQDTNAEYGVHEFDVYDPIAPRALFKSWVATSHELVNISGPISDFCPAVTTGSEALLYGVGFILEPPGSAGPQGTTFVENVGDEALYKVAGAAPATVTPLGPGAAMPAPTASGTPVKVTHPGPASWRIVTTSATPQELRLHLTAVPGWHATIDGRSLPLARFSDAMFQARLPAGRHTVVLNYWPEAFSVGIALAVVSALSLLITVALSTVRRRRTTSMAPPTS